MQFSDRQLQIMGAEKVNLPPPHMVYFHPQILHFLDTE